MRFDFLIDFFFPKRYPLEGVVFDALAGIELRTAELAARQYGITPPRQIAPVVARFAPQGPFARGGSLF